MKKILSMLLALVMLVTCFMALSACAPRPYLKDLEEAAENLEDADYFATYTDDEDNLGVGVVERLSAYDDDDNYLYVIVYASNKLASLSYEELKAELEAEKESTKREIERIKHILKKFDGELKSDEIDEYEDELKDLEEELEEYKNFVIGKSGKTVWYGTKDAIKDSKG